MRTILALLASLLMALPAAAQTASLDRENGRYSFKDVPEGVMRLDTRSGQVSLCARKDAGWACNAVPDERSALESEIARLQRENGAMKKDMLARGLPLPSGVAGGGSDKQRELNVTVPLPSDAEIDRMMTAFVYIIDTLLSLTLAVFLARLLLQWTRADFRNPLCQFIVRITNPLILPLRRILPPVGKVDTASVVAVLLIAIIEVAIMRALLGVGFPPAYYWIELVAIEIARTLLQMYFYAIVLYALLSLIAPGGYSPMQSVLATLCEPVLRPFRRIIPPIAKFGNLHTANNNVTAIAGRAMMRPVTRPLKQCCSMAVNSSSWGDPVGCSKGEVATLRQQFPRNCKPDEPYRQPAQHMHPQHEVLPARFVQQRSPKHQSEPVF